MSEPDETAQDKWTKRRVEPVDLDEMRRCDPTGAEFQLRAHDV